MIVTEPCPRCRGTLTRVRDIGETYHSCVQCGHIIYGALTAVSALPQFERGDRPKATDRSEIRRRQIRRAKVAQAQRQAA
jgi:hypothetical protein